MHYIIHYIILFMPYIIVRENYLSCYVGHVQLNHSISQQCPIVSWNMCDPNDNRLSSSAGNSPTDLTLTRVRTVELYWTTVKRGSFSTSQQYHETSTD